MGRTSVIIILGLIFTLGYFIINKKANENFAIRQTIEIFNRRRAQNLANSFASVYLYKVHDDTTWTPGQVEWSSIDFGEGINHRKQIDDDTRVTLKKQSFLGNGALLDVGEIRITAIAEVEGIVCSTLVSDRLIPYSYYGWFIDKWGTLGGSGPYLGPGEGVTGPFHSNTDVHIGGASGPVVDGNITCVGQVKYYKEATVANWRDNPNKFMGDWIYEHHPVIPFKADNIWLTADTQTSSFKIDDVFPGYDITKPLYVIMLDDGRVVVSKKAIKPGQPGVDIDAIASADAANVKVYDISDMDAYEFVMYSNKYNLRLQGTINGQLNISTDKNIYIDDDILYANDPRDDGVSGNTPSTDLLAIMAKGNILLSTNSIVYDYPSGYSEIPHRKDEDGNGYPDGAAIFASTYCLGTIKPEPEKYLDGATWETRDIPGTARGSYFTYGGRIQYQISATYNGYGATDPRQKGFAENIQYDERLRKMTPPGMPWTGNRRIYRWAETA